MQALERLAGIMESKNSSIALVERGDLEPIPRHPDFRIFAAMNPATDAGPCSLPPLVSYHEELPDTRTPVNLQHPEVAGGKMLDAGHGVAEH